MFENEKSSEHENIKELAAWGTVNALTAGQYAQLAEHSETCEACREAHTQYLQLISEGMPLLGARYDHQEGPAAWNDTPMRDKLFERIRRLQESDHPERREQLRGAPSVGSFLRTPIGAALMRAALAIFLVGGAGLVAYMHRRSEVVTDQLQSSTQERLQTLAADKRQAVDKLEDLLGAQARTISLLEHENAARDEDLTRLRSEVSALQERERGLSAAADASQEQLQSTSAQRDALETQLHDAEQAYASTRAEVASLRSEHDAIAKTDASLESKNRELSATARTQEQRISDDEQYLASDRDVRELMGARKLYIADVFDVDSRSRTRVPFGRIFYTQGKSLIFYAFDLDDEKGPKSAGAFQVWGRSVADDATPLNLGILYMDSETNRRWVLRFDDPKKLAEIDAVFVTVEPHGGSRTPTGKHFLYALLRNEANHP